MVELRTDRLVLREFVADDASALNAVESIPEVARNIGFDPSTLERSRELVRQMMAWQDDQPRRHVGLAITIHGNIHHCVGRCGLARTGEEPGEAELWYSLHPDHWGQGYMTEAIRTLVGYGFAELGLHRILAAIDPGNVGSWRVAEKIGMRREGHLVENAFIADEWCDSYLYAILAREWVDEEQTTT